jgi:hypothetical protein
MKRIGKRIIVIPDSQIRPGDDYEFLTNIGKYIVDMQPDIVVHLGDFADMPSLSSHDKSGTKSMEGKRYNEDVLSAHRAMNALMKPIVDKQNQQRKNKEKVWKPELILTLGNHENRIDRAINNDPKLDGLISVDDLGYELYGWNVIPFLQPIIIEGIAFCHYLVSGVMGRPVTTAQALINKMHMSCIVGHQQGRMIAYGKRADGKNITAMIVGSCYEHDEGYLNPQSNNHWRGLVVLNEVIDGEFDEIMVSLNYINRKYGYELAA